MSKYPSRLPKEEAAVIENQVLPINKSAFLLTEFANIYHASLISMLD